MRSFRLNLRGNPCIVEIGSVVVIAQEYRIKKPEFSNGFGISGTSMADLGKHDGSRLPELGRKTISFRFAGSFLSF